MLCSSEMSLTMPKSKSRITRWFGLSSMEAEMKVLLSGISIAALLTWGLPAWSPANAMTGQAYNEQGYNFAHPTGDADNVPVRAEVK